MVDGSWVDGSWTVLVLAFLKLWSHQSVQRHLFVKMALDFISFPAELAIALAILVKPAPLLLLGLTRNRQMTPLAISVYQATIAVNLFDRIFAS